MPRCAVIDLDPVSGRASGPRAHGASAGYRQHAGEVLFGVDAVVTRPGRVAVGAVLERG